MRIQIEERKSKEIKDQEEVLKNEFSKERDILVN